MRRIKIMACAIALGLAAPATAVIVTSSVIMAADEYTPDDVTALIELIDPLAPDELDVKKARDAYDSLTMAKRMQVKGYEKLEAAEKWIAAQGVILPVEDKQIMLKKTAGEVTLYVTDYTDRSTILAVYAPSPDSPQLSLVSPGSMMYDVSGTNNAIENDDCEIAVTKKPEYVQIDIVRLTPGTWTLKSSTDVTFVVADYIGSKPIASEDDASASQKTDSKQETSSGSPIMAIIAILACIGLFVGAKFIKFDKKPKKPENVEEEPEELSEEEQKKLFAEEWAKLSKKQEEEEKNIQNAPEKQPEDKRLYETVRYDEEDGDDGIEELTDEDFFGKKRF